MHRRRFLKSSLAAGVSLSLASRNAAAALLAPSDKVLSDITARTGVGEEVTLGKAAVQELADSLRGNVILPGHSTYDLARRVLNPTIDRHPALIVQPKGAADVQNAVTFARESNLLLAVKCGGHSPSGKSTCDGGMQLDLSLLRSVRVDPQRRVAQVTGGSWLGDLDHESMAMGLVTTAGTVSHTGVGGLTLGGGFGRLARRFGLAIDNVNSVDIVTADGRLLRASASDNPDLFWAVRGGGGNFGVVTNFEFGLHPMSRTVMAGNLLYPLAEARQVLNVYAEYAASAPDEMYVDGGLVSRPGGFSAVVLHVCYSGDPADADRLLAPLRKAGTIVADEISAQDYVAVQRSGDISDPRARGVYLKSGFASKLTPTMVDVLVDGFEPHAERGAFVGFQHAGGAIGRVANEATAFAHRHVQFDSLFVVDWPVDAASEEHVRYVKEYFAAYEPYTDGFYTNDMSADDTQQDIDRNYRGNYKRLLSIKRRYDPTNLFRLNANIVPG